MNQARALSEQTIAAVVNQTDGGVPVSAPKPTVGGLIPVVTPALVTLCVLVFAATFLRHHSGTGANQPLLPGANVGALTLGGQWWRLFTSIFVHLGIVHLAVNMWCLWDLGCFAERVYGRITLLLIFLSSGAAGAMASLAWHPFSVEAGASGAIFGIAGALIASFLLGDYPFHPSAMKAQLFSVLAFAGYNLAIGIFGHSAGNAAHIGGLVCGFALGSLVAVLPSRGAVTVVACGALLGCYAILAHAQGYIVPAERGRVALEAGHTDVAVRELNAAVRKNPRYADGYLSLAQAYLQQQRLADAEQAYRKAVDLDPQAADTRVQLGTVLLAERRTKEALAEFQNVLKVHPADAAAVVGIGTAAALDGDYARALEAFERAARLDPANPQVYAGIGVAALQLNRPEQAIAAFEKWTDLQPESATAFVNLALAYKAKGMEHQAEQAYQRALSLGKGH